MDTIQLFTVGYGRWPAGTRWERLVRALHDNRIEVLCDIRHSPCASNLDPANAYGPRRWHLQSHGEGIAPALAREGIEYRWLVELGNPQKKDPDMRVLREHLSHSGSGWPIHRGLELLSRLVTGEGKRCCLMCACKDYETCHRSLIASAFSAALSPRAIKVTDIGDVRRA